MSLKDTKDFYKRGAKVYLPNYQEYTTNELANMYVEAEDNNNERLMNGCISALILHYFSWTKRWQYSCESLQKEEDEFYDMLQHAIEYTLKARAWLDPSKSIYNDPNGPDKAFNQALGTMRAIEYQKANKDCRKSNTQVVSVEESIDDNGDCALDYMGCSEEEDIVSGAAEAIKYYLKRNQPIEALILYTFADGHAAKQIKRTATYDEKDSTGKDVKKKLVYYQEDFDKRKMVQHLNAFTADEMEYFCKRYGFAKDKGDALIDRLQNMTNPQFYNYLKKLILECKNDPNQTILKCLCK